MGLTERVNQLTEVIFGEEGALRTLKTCVVEPLLTIFISDVLRRRGTSFVYVQDITRIALLTLLRHCVVVFTLVWSLNTFFLLVKIVAK